MRACQPAVEGTVRRDDVEIHYERWGYSADRTKMM